MFFTLIHLLAFVMSVFSAQAVHHMQLTRTNKVLSQENYSLADRYTNTYVNNVFSDNILLTLSYMDGKVKDGDKISWDKVRNNGEYRFVLNPGQTFAFHDQVLKQYQNKVVVTTNAHFNASEGFESDGWLVGDGVCHLASFMNVAAKAAGLTVVSPTPHNFAKIADVPRKFGVAIYYSPTEVSTSSLQNLYITNTFSKKIAFVFNHENDTLHIQVEEVN